MIEEDRVPDGSTRRTLRRVLSEPLSADERDALHKTALAVRRYMPMMVVGCFATAATAVWLLKDFPVLPWMAAYLACAMLSSWGDRPFRRNKPDSTRGEMLAMAASNMTLTAMLGIAGIYFFNGDILGRTIALLSVGGGIICSYTIARAHPVLVLTSGAPPALCLVGASVAGLLGGDWSRLSVGSTISVVAFVLALIPLWRSSRETEREERRLRRELEDRRLQAESAMAAKSTFIATVSHELRTPINAILAGAGELERLDTSAAAQANARLIQSAGRMMRTLLNDLLDLAKLEAGRMTVEMIPYDFRAVIAEQMRFWRPEARNRGVRLRLRGSRLAPGGIKGDPTRLRQVLNNLLSNALKFTDAGSITLQLYAPQRRDGVQEIRIDVIDTGSGMDAAQLARLFTPFDQGAASVARTHGGTGLGLSISRELARLMGGDLTVQSEPGRGSIFTIVFQGAAVANAAPAQEPEPATLPTLSGKFEVLVVDDHEINRRAMGLFLGPLDASLTMATCGDEALALLAVKPFDVVLMDVHMPGIDGHETTRQLRARPGPNRDIPVIAVTGAVDEPAIRACRAAGMNDWVAKPIDVGELFAALARQIDNGREAASGETRADVGP